MAPVYPHTGLPTETVLEIRVYPGSTSQFMLYEDAGDGYGYERGEYSLIPMTWDDAASTLTLGLRQGQYPGMAPNRTFHIIRVDKGRGVGMSSDSQTAVAVTYTGEPLRVPLP
jgi:alpha-D-xyloside xylohydrolase